MTEGEIVNSPGEVALQIGRALLGSMYPPLPLILNPSEEEVAAVHEYVKNVLSSASTILVPTQRPRELSPQMVLDALNDTRAHDDSIPDPYVAEDDADKARGGFVMDGWFDLDGLTSVLNEKMNTWEIPEYGQVHRRGPDGKRIPLSPSDGSFHTPGGKY